MTSFLSIATDSGTFEDVKSKTIITPPPISFTPETIALFAKYSKITQLSELSQRVEQVRIKAEKVKWYKSKKIFWT